MVPCKGLFEELRKNFAILTKEPQKDTKKGKKGAEKEGKEKSKKKLKKLKKSIDKPKTL